MIVPPYLKKGDKIRVVAPAGKIKKELVVPGVEWLKAEGFEVIVGNHVLDEYNQFAGNDEDRLNDMQEALDDPETSAIICARGGYGSIRIIDKLDFTLFQKNPKWLVGFSDITVIHNQLNKMGIASVHGAMLRHCPKPGVKIPKSIQSLFQMLNGGEISYKVKWVNGNRLGTAKAELVGGNLSIIYSLLGTPFDLNMKGRILFIEDVGEYHYQIDRMMHSLRLSGNLAELAGLVAGDFSKMKDDKKTFGMDVSEIIAEAVKDYSYPVCFGFPAGHNKKNMPLVFGKKWEMEVAELGTWLKMK